MAISRKQLRFLQLGLQQILLRAHSGAIAGVCRLPGLFEQVTVQFEDRQRFGQVSQLEVRCQQRRFVRWFNQILVGTESIFYSRLIHDDHDNDGNL